jgi:putative endonuclease
MQKEIFYVYMLTNPQRKMLYTGVTNNLALRIIQHWKSRGMSQSFTGRYFCYNLIYFEEYKYINNAIAREKEIKGWRREKKEELINSKNPSWEILNEKICGSWPPPKYQIPPSSEL